MSVLMLVTIVDIVYQGTNLTPTKRLLKIDILCNY